MRALISLSLLLAAVDANALCAIPEIDQICAVAPLGDTCFIGAVTARDVERLELVVDEVVGENPLELAADDSAVFVIDANYFAPGYGSGSAVVDDRAIVCAVLDTLTFDHHLTDQDRLELDFTTSLDARDAARAFATGDCSQVASGATCGNRGTQGCSSTNGASALCLLALLAFSRRLRTCSR